ncbi:MAG: beta-propeller domain-containing protein [Lachnospiraceae bacterium]|nr:beta-propeller domain-containing protein [Lachnospiraceae bacterium]
MDEKKLLEQIRQSASDLTPPESLSPEAIEKLLTNTKPNAPDQADSETSDSPRAEAPLPETTADASRKTRRRTFFPYYRIAGAAAAVVLCMTALLQVNKIQKESADLEKSAVRSAITAETNTGQDDSAAVFSSEKASGDLADSLDENVSGDLAEHPDGNSVDALSDSSEEHSTDALSSGSAMETIDIAEDTSVSVTSEDTLNSSDAGSASAETSTLSPAGSYEEVFEALHEQFYYDDTVFYAASGARDIISEDGAKTSDSISSGSASENGSSYGSAADSEGMEYEEITLADSASDAASSSQGLDRGGSEEAADYSATNIQEIGVDEADIVKTDGTYIYILRQNGAVTIVNADPASLEIVSTITPTDTGLTQTQELYLDGDVLSVIAQREDTSLEEENDTYYTETITQSVIYTYDISDRTAPKLTGTVVQDGYYNTSRKNGDYIYLFTSYYPDIRATYEESNIVPCINQDRLKASDFYLPEHLNSSAYLLISSMDIRKSGEILDKKALVSGTSNFYVSTENIYIANENWSSDTTTTTITKFHYEDGIVTGMAAGSVKGYLNNSFSMNEYNGYLRVVSTYYDEDWDERNALYVMDETLNITGAIENLAKGETIRSARFFGDTGYFVTFRQTDPLFSVDLSDPANPVILGELKVSGFSSYLHFYGENLLLGMGYEADETTGSISGVKLSMFDISDPTDAKELHRIIIPGVTWCPSMDNYKSILINPEKNLFGFFCEDRYLVFSYDTEKGFVSELIYDLVAETLIQQSQTESPAESNKENSEEQSKDTGDTDIATVESFVSAETTADSEAAMPDDMLIDDMLIDTDTVSSGSSVYSSISVYNTRGLYIGNTFYLAGDLSVIVFDMADGFNKIGSLQFAE